MRSFTVFLFCLVVFVRIGYGQDQKPLTRDQVTDSLAISAFQASDIEKSIDEFGIGFELDETNLAAVMEAGKKGNRSGTEMSAVTLRLVKMCHTCRNMFWAPLTPPELVNWVKTKGSASALEELRVRGSESLPISIDYIDDLRKAGATPELMAAVEDRLRVSPAEGYKPMRLEKSRDFNPAATSGKLVIKTEIDEKVEFVFRHNALFWKTTAGAEPRDLGCIYTAFGPFSAARPDWSFERVQNPKVKRPKKGQEPVISKREFVDPSGRPTLVVSVYDVEPGVHEYELVVSWKR